MKKINFSNLLKVNKLSNFEVVFAKDQQRIIIAVIIVLLIILLFRQKIYYLIEKIIIIGILFLLILVITKNLMISIIGAIILFLIINIAMSYTKKVEQFKLERFDNPGSDEKKEHMSSSSSADGLAQVMKQLQNSPSSIEDFKETSKDDKLTPILEKYSDDNIPTPVRKAQMETFQLIDTIKVLKDTLETFTPVLAEGKKIMSLFESMKI